jgi:hypothetical protein
MATDPTVSVYGAYGHTARFVVAELLSRGLKPILCGRDDAKLNATGIDYPGLASRVASVHDPASLDRAFADASAVINCAGPFVDTAEPLIAAALRSGIHYLDIAAEQAAVLAVFERFAKNAPVVIAPAMGFYGGLADLLATAAMGNWNTADEITIVVALDRWFPTRGTRVTGQRHTGKRFVFLNNKLEQGDLPVAREWNFPPPFGTQTVVGLSLAEAITISRHLKASDIRSYLSSGAMQDLRDPNTPEPTAIDESGRSSQIFLVEAIVRKGVEERRARASGRDIYAITAPIVVEATERLLRNSIARTGVAAAGELFDAEDFLRSLSPGHLSLDI